MITIGERIRQRRKELGISITQLSKESNISNGNLSCIENDKYLPSSAALISLSEVLKCSIDWILLGESDVFFSQNHAPTKNGYIGYDSEDDESSVEVLNYSKDKQFEDKSSISNIMITMLFDQLTEEDKEEILKNIDNKIKGYSINLPEHKKNTADSYPFSCNK